VLLKGAAFEIFAGSLVVSAEDVAVRAAEEVCDDFVDEAIAVLLCTLTASEDVEAVFTVAFELVVECLLMLADLGFVARIVS